MQNFQLLQDFLHANSNKVRQEVLHTDIKDQEYVLYSLESLITLSTAIDEPCGDSLPMILKQ